MYAPTRDEARQFLIDAWAKYRASQPLSVLEQIAVTAISAHPEYHAVLEAPQRHRERDYTPDAGEVNPFLHLQMHIAVAEQLSIDQPRGIRAHFARLREARGDEHAALHAIVDCLAETLWQAQRHQTGPDETVYLGCLERMR
ncbi:MAG: DUF1841 family protein [Casimicrobiaceae bacterium]